jgi:4'-phosphopantetheinyl transferase EntD
MIANVVLPALDEPFRKMTFPVLMDADVILDVGIRTIHRRQMSLLDMLNQQATDAFPTTEGMAIQIAAIADHRGSLLAEELAAIEQAVEKRQREFATGRWLARQAMVDLDLPVGAIGRGEQREPIWPQGTLGSITHAEDLAAVAVARFGVCQSLGLDLECWSRVTPNLHSKLFTSAEREQLAFSPETAAGLLFSAKEAGYKATFPLASRFIGFHEAEIDVDWSRGQFSIRYVGEHEVNRVMEAGRGYFVVVDQLVLSLYVID